MEVPSLIQQYCSCLDLFDILHLIFGGQYQNGVAACSVKLLWVIVWSYCFLLCGYVGQSGWELLKCYLSCIELFFGFLLCNWSGFIGNGYGCGLLWLLVWFVLVNFWICWSGKLYMNRKPNTSDEYFIAHCASNAPLPVHSHCSTQWGEEFLPPLMNSLSKLSCKVVQLWWCFNHRT